MRATREMLTDPMITDIFELKVRLAVLFEIADLECNPDPDKPPHPLPVSLLAAVDLLDEIQQHLLRDDADEIKLKAMVKAWQHRDGEDGKPRPRAVPERNDL
jgi:hypothetical protein